MATYVKPVAAELDPVASPLVTAEAVARASADSALTVSLAALAAAGATDVEVASAVATVTAAVSLKQDASSAATDAELASAVATINAAAATDAELAAALDGVTAALALKQDAATAASDVELAAAVSTLNTALSGKQDAGTAATDAELTAAVAMVNAAMATDAEVAALLAPVTAALDLKAPLASPALTGSPTAPTQTAGDSTTKLATGAAVQAEVALDRARLTSVESGRLLSTVFNAPSIDKRIPRWDQGNGRMIWADPRTFNVDTYGAVGDAILNAGGTAVASGTDNKTAIRATVTALVAAGGGILEFNGGVRGQYAADLSDGLPLVTVPPNIPVHIRGAGCGNVNYSATVAVGTRLLRTAGSGEFVKGTGASDNGYDRAHCTARDIEFNGLSTPGDIVALARCNEVDFTQVRLTYNYNYGSAGCLLRHTQAWNSRFTSCFFNRGGSGTATPAVIVGALTPTGTSAQPGSNTAQFTTCQWEENTGTDLQVLGDPAVAVRLPTIGVTLIGCKLERSFAGQSYPVFDLDYVDEFSMVGGHVDINQATATSKIMMTRDDSAVTRSISFAGVSINHNGTTFTHGFEINGGVSFSWTGGKLRGVPTNKWFKIMSSVAADNDNVSIVGVPRYSGSPTPFPLVDDQRPMGTRISRLKGSFVLPVSNTNGLTLGEVNGINVYVFPDAATGTLWGTFTMPGDMLPSSVPICRLYWAPDAAGGNNVRWSASFRTNGVGFGALTDGGTNPTLTSGAGTTANRLVNSDFAISLGATPGGIYSVKIQRLGADALDTYVGGVQLAHVAIIYDKAL